MPDGLQFDDSLIDLRTGETVTRRVRCAQLNVPAPPLPPLPPSPGDVLGQTPIPIPQVNLDPRVDGLVGLETRLWYDQPATATVTVSLAPWVATVTAGIVEVRWDMGNGDTATSAARPDGSIPDAAYTYQRQCECTVTATAVWGGTYTLTLEDPAFADVAPFTVGIGTQPFVGTRAYRVIEVEAVVHD